MTGGYGVHTQDLSAVAMQCTELDASVAEDIGVGGVALLVQLKEVAERNQSTTSWDTGNETRNRPEYFVPVLFDEVYGGAGYAQSPAEVAHVRGVCVGRAPPSLVSFVPVPHEHAHQRSALLQGKGGQIGSRAAAHAGQTYRSS